MATGTLLLASGLVATSCIDSSFDLEEDIDMTMGFGADGLSVKLGSTGKVYLDDILDIDKSVKLDGSNIYYLVEEGSTDVNISVDEVTTSIQNATLLAAFKFGSIMPDGVNSIPITADNWNTTADFSGQTDDFTFSVTSIPDEVKHLANIYPIGGTQVHLSLKLNTTPNIKVRLSKVKDLKIEMPAYLRIKGVSKGSFEGNVITIPQLDNPASGEICSVDVECIDLGDNGEVTTSEITLPAEKSRIKLAGNFKLVASGDFYVTRDDKVTLSMDIVLGNGQPGQRSPLTLDKVVGKFDPAIDPTVESIDIQSKLPDFLQDDEVRIKVANPTLRFDIDMTQIPLSIDFSGTLIAHKGAQNGQDGFDKPVALPEEGKAELLKSKQNYVYFSQQDTPYDPTGLVANSKKYKVSNLGTLVEQLPECIKVDVGNNQIKLKDEFATIQLGKDYAASLGYKIFVPFQFNEGLKIVYRDSTNSLNDDLKDYQAEGLAVKATAYSTVPLDLNATLYPVDVNGNEISSIQVDQVAIQASSDGATEKATELEITLKLTNPKDLQKVDRFRFRVSADANQSNLSLSSKQYLRFENVRLKLKGQVIGDFN